MAARFQFEDRAAQERALRLRGYAQSDRAQALAAKLSQREEEDAARQALMEQRLELERAANERKTNTSEGRRQIAEDNLKRLQEASATEDRIRQKKAELAAEEQKTKADRAEAIINDAIGFQKDARGMDPSSPKFDQQLQDLYAGYPLAGEHPSVQNWQKYHLPLREKYVAAEIAKQAERQQKYGTETIKEGDVKTTRPLGSPEEEMAKNKAEHDRIEAIVNANSGKPQDKDTMARLNQLKSKLGYNLVDPKTGAEIPNSAVAPPVVPRGTTNSSATTQQQPTAGLSPIPTNLTAEVPPVAETPVPAPAEVVNPNLGADDSAIQPLSEVASTGAVAQPPAAAAPAPVAAAAPAAPNLSDLAQKALDDPNATEAHKAAAKRFLNQQGGKAAGDALISAGT